MAPVDPVMDSTREGGKGLRPAAAIALSGGGYRAMLFHTGSLWRMGQLGFYLDQPLTRIDASGNEHLVGKMERISSVSGGSIASAMLALAFPTLERAGSRFDQAFGELVVAPLRKLASTTLAGGSIMGAWPIVKSILAPGSVNEHVAETYDRLLFKGKTLQDLPDRVRFVFNASNLQSGALWRFSKPYMRDWRVGKVDAPITPLAAVVAASSAFPPFLAPAMLDLHGQTIVSGSDYQQDLQRPPFTTQPALADGGVYDNLGLETCYKRYHTLFVSNAGKPFAPQPKVSRNWLFLGNRCIDVLDNQVLVLRKRLLLHALTIGERNGAFWDIQHDINMHPCNPRLECPLASTTDLAQIPTDLAAKDTRTQERLINWGYAVADAAIRAWFNPTHTPVASFPYLDTRV